MSELSNFIDKYCDGFDVCISSVTSDLSSSIEITDLTTMGWHNINVSLGQELQGLKMIMAEWEYLETNLELNDTIN